MEKTLERAKEQITPEARQIAQAAYLWDELSSERWSYRTLATRVGTSKSKIESRMKGDTPLMFGDIEIFAEVLRRDPVELFATLHGITNYTPKGSLSDYSSVASITELHDFRVQKQARLRPMRDDHDATISPLKKNA